MAAPPPRLCSTRLERSVTTAPATFYISDQDDFRVRKVDTKGNISTVAGSGVYGYAGDGGPAAAALIGLVSGLAVDAAGNLYISDSDANVVRMVTPAGAISTVAGNGTAGYSGNNGPAASASLNGPKGLAVDAVGNLYIADSNNNRVRKVSGGMSGSRRRSRRVPVECDDTGRNGQRTCRPRHDRREVA
jgi:sugar lactone lactonase YvrE